MRFVRKGDRELVMEELIVIGELYEKEGDIGSV